MRISLQLKRALSAGAMAIAATATALCLGVPAVSGATPRVVVSIKPLHALVAGVMEGVAAPQLLLQGAGSPHTYNLRPSDARALEGAEVVFWIGGAMEAFLEKPLAALGAKAAVVEMLRSPGVTPLPAREGGAWDAHEEEEGPAHRVAEGPPARGGPEASSDGHVWLDPANAKAMAMAASEALAQVDPANKARYAGNAARLAGRIDALDAELAAQLAPVGSVPYVVFHDAYQYFERRYALKSVGSITVSPERAPGARRVREVRGKIRDLGARCVFGEPQFPPALLATLTEGTGTRTGELDPLGADIPPGPDAWFALMRALAASLARCLR